MSLLAVLWRRRLWILTVTGLSIVIALLVTLWMPDTYRATATVLITPPGYRPEIASAPPSAETYKEIAVTPEVVQEALRRADPSGEAGWTPGTALRRMRVETYEERGPYNAVMVSPLLGLAVTDTDPERAAAMANGWASGFQEISRRFKGRGSQRLADALREQAASAAERLAGAEEELRTFRRESGLKLLAEEARVQAESVASIHAARIEAENGIESTSSVLAALERELASSAGSGEEADLAKRMSDAAGELAEAARVLRDYRRQSDIAVVTAKLQAARARLEAYRKERESLEDRAARAGAELERIQTVLAEAAAASPAATLRTSLEEAPPADHAKELLSDMAVLEQLQDQALQSLRERYYQARIDAETLGPLIADYDQKIEQAEITLRAIEADADLRNDGLQVVTERRDRALREVSDLGDLQVKTHDDVASLSLDLTRLEARAASQRKQETSLHAEAMRLEARLAEGQLREEHLVGELTLVRQLHDSLAARAQAAEAAEAGDASDISIVSLALPPERPVSPRPLLNLLAAALFGLAGSSTLALLVAGDTRP